MRREAIRKFSTRVAGERAACFGTKVSFRGIEQYWPMAAPRPDTALGEGGFREEIDLTARVPAAVFPAPGIGERVTIVATGRVLRVEAVCPADANNPLAAEHLVGLVTA